MTKPITPGEVSKKKAADMPDQVIEAFNELIAKHWDGKASSFKQTEIVDLIVSRMEVRRGAVFDNGWLNVEELYEKAGWEVDYDQPGWADEHYEPVFTFTKLKGK